jgi:redox-sensitive bicupin YhaK (pirin superfamily)
MASAIAALVESRKRDLGGFGVRRVLPSFPHKMVGPFIFFDHMGPVRFEPGAGVDVRPHPHIGLATVTYLFAGSLVHRDSLGVVQTIRPGDVNWMTAGRGIVHSERSPPDARAGAHDLHGIQTWLALPRAYEEVEPSFHHHPGATLPFVRREGIALHVIAGHAYDVYSPVRVYGDTLYVAAELKAGATLEMPTEHAERAIYIVDGLAQLEDVALHPGTLAVLAPGEPAKLRALENCRAMLLGGAHADADRHVWWNFVSSSRERIDEAKRAWSGSHFAQVPGETEFIPLPEH